MLVLSITEKQPSCLQVKGVHSQQHSPPSSQPAYDTNVTNQFRKDITNQLSPSHPERTTTNSAADLSIPRAAPPTAPPSASPARANSANDTLACKLDRPSASQVTFLTLGLRRVLRTLKLLQGWLPGCYGCRLASFAVKGLKELKGLKGL